MISQRLKEFGKAKFGSINSLERALNLKRNGLSPYIYGISVPGSKLLVKLQKLGCDINWLLTGNEKEKIAKAVREAIPQYQVEATVPAGISEMYDRTDWLEFKELNYEPKENYFWLLVDQHIGLSMIPSIQPGDSLLISFKEKVKNGDVVAARWGKNNAAIKVYNEDNNTVVLSSSNPHINLIILPKSKVTAFKVKLIEKQ